MSCLSVINTAMCAQVILGDVSVSHISPTMIEVTDPYGNHYVVQASIDPSIHAGACGCWVWAGACRCRGLADACRCMRVQACR